MNIVFLVWDHSRLQATTFIHREKVMFTTEHYAVIADIISDCDIEPANELHLDDRLIARGKVHMRFRIVEDLIEDFKADNPNFDEAKFLEACHISPEQWSTK